MSDYSHRNPGEEEPRIVRRTHALEMKRDGATYQQIADALGYSSKGHAYKDLQKALDAANRDQTLAAEQFRALQNERLEIMFGAIWPGAVGMDPEMKGPNLRSVEMVLKIMERQAKLNGVDAPVRSEVTISQNVDQRIEQLLEVWGIKKAETIQGELVADVTDAEPDAFEDSPDVPD